MKKFALMLTLALPFAFASCGDDEKEISIEGNQVVELNYDAETTLKASEKNGTWASNNEFVATVDKDGKVKANHVGEAVITVSKDGVSASVKVNVKPIYNDFTFPILTWGANMATVKSNVPATLTLAGESNNVLTYVTNGNYPFYIYAFESDKLASSSLTVSIDDDEALEAWFEQYYGYVADTDDYDGGLLYADAATLANATNAVIYYPIFDEGSEEPAAVSLIWTAVDHTKAATLNVKALKATHGAAVRAMMK